MAEFRWYWLALGLVLGVVVIAAAVFLYRMPWVEISTDIGYGPEARRNPYLAAEQYLARLGIETDRIVGVQGLDRLAGGTDALMMTGSHRLLGEARVEQLLGWVEGGGHLVLLARSVYDPARGGSDDAILDRLGVRVERSGLGAAFGPFANDALDELVRAGIEPDALCGGEQDVTVQVGDEALAVRFSRLRALAYDGDDYVGSVVNTTGTQLLQFERGAGYLTVLTTTTMWRNELIGCHDHARFLGLLLGNAPRLWWFASIEMPPLYEIVWKRFPHALLAAALTLLLWGWARAFRFGAVHGRGDTSRRQLLEHVTGAARFHWERGQGEVLLDLMRADIHRLRRKRRLDEPAFEHAARRAGLDRDGLDRAMNGRAGRSREAFKSRVRELQELRRAL